ncbi:helix-turn-helix transcriptional regulator [Actinoplanes auranticolor]|nr:helix-turn-helix transcriptional regulator [Actinoplanes auranticolor]
MVRERESAGSAELGRFLRARRTQMCPEDAGVVVGPGVRRTPGLRREEIAVRAGLSVDYYTRLERGREHRPGPAVVDALATALNLDPSEHAHLIGLAARVANLAPPPAAPADEKPSHGVSLILESLRPYPALLLSRTTDVLASNPGGLGTLPGIEDWPQERQNLTRYSFLHPAARGLFADWDASATGCIARLRALAGLEPDAPDLVLLVDELRSCSAEFARLWERYEVRPHRRDTKTLHHPRVGTVTLGIQSMRIEGTPGHSLLIYHAEPGTVDHDTMVLLDGDDPDQAG